MNILFNNPSVSRKVNNQIRYYMFSSLCSRFVFIYNIIVLFFQEFGLSFAQIMIISAIEGIVTFIFEIPSGVLADKWGRKKTVLTGIFLGILGLFCYIIYPSFLFFVFAEILLAVGSAFESGASGAIIYRKFEVNNIKSAYKSCYLKMSRLSSVAAAITALGSSFLFTINIYLPIYLSIVFIMLSFVFLLLVKDDDTLDSSEAENTLISNSIKQSRPVKKIIHNSLSIFVNNRRLLMLTLCSAFLITMSSNVCYLSQSYLVDLNFPVEYMGIFYFVFNLTLALSASCAEKLFKSFRLQVFLFLFLLMGIITILLSYQIIYTVVALYLVYRFINGISIQTINSEIPAETDDTNRATTLSMVCFVQGAFTAVFDPFLGILIDNTGISKMYLMLGAVTSVLTFFALLYVYLKPKIFCYK